MLLLIPIHILLFAQTYELNPSNPKDTINYIDVAGKKQGKWIIYGKHKPEIPCYKPNQKIEEGKYQDNRKTGVWVDYYCNSNKKSEITYVNGRPNGYAVMYYENGNKKEEGQWVNNRWVGDYKLYYENGQIQHDFKFNAGGKREGNQIYKYENGQTAIEGNFSNGKESGTFKEYYENGNLKAIKNFNNGDVDVASIQFFEDKNQTTKQESAVKNNLSKSITEVKNEELTVSGANKPMVLNGKHILYNKNRQVSKDGIFKDNRLMEGKAYIYDDNGILIRIAIFKNGIYVGDAPIEK
ncbi:MAG: hypothetical protein N3F09_04150 [Bacteroidia bacterium]|nr:hypothetical protein [Bacteroidia bacterium]